MAQTPHKQLYNLIKPHNKHWKNKNTNWTYWKTRKEMKVRKEGERADRANLNVDFLGGEIDKFNENWWNYWKCKSSKFNQISCRKIDKQLKFGVLVVIFAICAKLCVEWCHRELTGPMWSPHQEKTVGGQLVGPWCALETFAISSNVSGSGLSIPSTCRVT